MTNDLQKTAPKKRDAGRRRTTGDSRAGGDKPKKRTARSAAAKGSARGQKARSTHASGHKSPADKVRGDTSRAGNRKVRQNRRLQKPADSDSLPPETSAPGVTDAPTGMLPNLRAAVGRLGALKRPLLLVFRLAVVAAVVLGAVAVGQLIEEHVRTSDAFATTEVTVEGQERLSRDDIMAAAGLQLGKNVFELSPEAAEAALLKHPWVQTASVTRRLPGSYYVEVEERKAVAVAALDALYLVGDDASVFKAHASGDPVDLPIITGLGDEAFESDPPLRAAALVSAVALLHDYRDVGLWRREPISEIHVGPDSSLSLYAGQETTHVRLGRRPFRDKLRRFRKILDRLREDRARPAYVYLDNARRPDRVTVRLK